MSARHDFGECRETLVPVLSEGALKPGSGAASSITAEAPVLEKPEPFDAGITRSDRFVSTQFDAGIRTPQATPGRKTLS